MNIYIYRNLHVPKRQTADVPGGGLRLYPISSSRMGDDQRSKTLSLYVESQGCGLRLKIYEDTYRMVPFSDVNVGL